MIGSKVRLKEKPKPGSWVGDGVGTILDITMGRPHFEEKEPALLVKFVNPNVSPYWQEKGTVWLRPRDVEPVEPVEDET